jgi:Ni/Co efflux regulator RcnB
MKRFYLNATAAGMALALLAAPLAMAQMQNHEDDTHGASPSHPTMQHATPSHAAIPQQHMDQSHMAMQHGTMMAPHEDHAAPVPMEHNGMGPQHDMQHQASYGHQWHNGDRYNGGRNVVRNWNQYHLRQPPSGYEWVQDGGQFVLIAVASGIIADIIANSVN